MIIIIKIKMYNYTLNFKYFQIKNRIKYILSGYSKTTIIIYNYSIIE